MYEGRRLEGVARLFAGHSCGRELAKLVVHERQQVARRSAIAGVSRFE
jgi:hypothetical protein